MKKALIFDMDGVLLEPRGYHLALQETVRLGAEKLGFESITLNDELIAQFEGLGISCEWHSSAASLAILAFSGELSLTPLFDLLKREPVQIPARIRLKRAIETITGDVQHINESETLESSSFRIFQELILGSVDFERIYGIKSSLNVKSYLLQFDQPLLGSDTREKLLTWLKHPEHGCVVMTNRPSSEMPDAQYGLQLVGMEGLPLIGNNDMEWLAHQVGGETANFLKPNPAHALAALLTLTGKGVQESLLNANELLNGASADNLAFDEIIVFEDTPAGLISVGKMGDILREKGLSVQVRKIGISPSVVKSEFLRAQGAKVFADVNVALEQSLVG
jgi:beta-phosphoglucomutase-like phosphatase (HAD superfamily)